MSTGQREALTVLARSSSAAHRQVQRAKVLLMAADGVANSQIAAKMGVTPVTVRSWRDRFAREGLAKFSVVRAGRGRKPGITPEQIEEIVRLTQHESLPGQRIGAVGRWPNRSVSSGHGSADLVRAWPQAASGQDVQALERSTVRGEKFIDVVGLYLNPPEKAVALCMDEKTSIQALDHTQASLPMTKGQAGTTTSDYKRHGTTTLLAALNAVDGTVVGSCMDKHRHENFLKFIRTVDKEVPKGLAVHMILDNYATHEHPAVKAWMQAHPRFQLHFTPTSSSWPNLVERWFRELTGKALRRASSTPCLT